MAARGRLLSAAGHEPAKPTFGYGRSSAKQRPTRSEKLLVTGFGPFPGAPDNPTAALVRALAREAPEVFGAGELRALVLPTEYKRSWAALRRLYAAFDPDIVMHFGLSSRAEAVQVERMGRRRIDPLKLDAAGYAPHSGLARRSGPDTHACTFPIDAIVAALTEAGIPAALSDDAGGYVCNATLYRSLSAAPPGRCVGFLHVPLEGVGGLTQERLREAAGIALRVAVMSRTGPLPWGEGVRGADG